MHRYAETNGPHDPVSPNLLLEELGTAARATLRDVWRGVSYRAGDTILTADAPVAHVLFVESGLVTFHWTDLDGATAEVESCGPEGAVALLEALSRRPVAFDIRAELATSGLLVPADALRQLAETDSSVTAAFWAHALDQRDRLRRNVGCASRHGARARLADYLLALDGICPGARLPLIQEGLAAALGVYRTTVTALVAGLVEDGAVATGRGWLKVLDSSVLSQAACGCRSRGHPAVAARRS